METRMLETMGADLVHRARLRDNYASKRSLLHGALPEDSRMPENRQRPDRRRKERLTVTLPVELLERLRNAVYWTPRLTVAGFLQQTLIAALDHLEQQRGEPFPRRMAELRGGRPRSGSDPGLVRGQSLAQP